MERPARRGRPTRLIILLTTIGLASMGIALSAGALAYTGQPSFCDSCHVMSTRYVSWQRSTHARVAACLDCHSEPGAVGEIKAHLDGTRYLFVMLTGESAGAIIRGRVSNESCLRCHAAERLPTQAGKHRVAHQAHLKRDVSCTDCHGNLVHGSLRGTAARPSMTMCLDCHTKITPAVATGCTTCHGPVPVPSLVSSSGLAPRRTGGP